MTVHAAPPALVSPDCGAEHLGLTRSGLSDVLRLMRADPQWAGRVIMISRKRIAAAPADVVAFLRARHASPVTNAAAPAANDTPPAAVSGVDRVLALVGAERVPAARAGGRL